MKRNKKGFTITELVIVIAVIAILAAVLIPTFSGVITKAQNSAAIQQARNVYAEYIATHDYTAGGPARNMLIQLEDDKFVAVVDGKVHTAAVFASKAEAVSANIGITDADIVYEGNDVSVPESSEPAEPSQPAEPKVFYAIGDSITNGKGVDSTRWTLDAGWIKYVMEENGYDTAKSRNLGISGLGFNTKAANYTIYIDDVIEKTAAVTGQTFPTGAKFNDYNLADADIITVALGINDWKNSAVTVDAYFAKMESCLTRIREINPTCEIYYILPFNTSIIGTYDTNYSFGSAGDSNTTLCYSLTLQEFNNRIRAELEGNLVALNIKIIEIEGLTRDIMTTHTTDGLHPNAAGYEKIGRELAAALRNAG